MPATCATPVLIPAETLATRITELAREIEAQYGARTPVHLICVLKGGFVFLADLVRQLNLPVTLDFISMSSYAKGTTSSGEVKLVKDLDSGIQGRDVIVVEDIVDTGLTLQYLATVSDGSRNVIHFKLSCSDGGLFVPASVRGTILKTSPPSWSQM